MWVLFCVNNYTENFRAIKWTEFHQINNVSSDAIDTQFKTYIKILYNSCNVSKPRTITINVDFQKLQQEFQIVYFF